tara:strand:- start:545 stop:928 length:384 start_codon:yes stop_codon:yes gene_type:complete
MATYNIRKEEGKIIVEVSLPGLPTRAADAQRCREAVRGRDVRNYLTQNGILFGACLQSGGICNYRGNPVTGTFIYAIPQENPLISGPLVEKVIKDLTPAPEPVIIEEQPKKRKRVKRVSKTGNQTTS